jgi:hypothetical protein
MASEPAFILDTIVCEQSRSYLRLLDLVGERQRQQFFVDRLAIRWIDDEREGSPTWVSTLSLGRPHKFYDNFVVIADIAVLIWYPRPTVPAPRPCA